MAANDPNSDAMSTLELTRMAAAIRVKLERDGIPLDLHSAALGVLVAASHPEFISQIVTDPHEFSLLVSQLHFCARWSHTAFPLFKLSENIAAQFAMTDPDALPTGALELPFAAFTVHLPAGTLTLGNTLLGPVALDIQTYRNHAAAYDQKMYSLYQLISASQKANDREEMLRLARTLHAILEKEGRGTLDIVIREFDSERCPLIKTDLPTDHKLIKDWINQELPVVAEFEVGVRATRRYLKSVLRMIANFLLYLNSEKPDITPSFALPIKVGKKKVKPKVVVLGRSTKLHATVLHAYRASQGSGDGPKFKLQTRFVVRGHWRNQAHGAGRQLRTLKWIKPFFKGPEDALANPRKYQVDA